MSDDAEYCRLKDDDKCDCGRIGLGCLMCPLPFSNERMAEIMQKLHRRADELENQD